MQIANRMRSLHRRDDAEFRETRNVRWVYDLRMLVAPTWLSDLSLLLRHSLQSFLVFIHDKSIRVIADGVRLHLDSLLQSFFQHRQQVFFLHAQESRTVRDIAVRSQQGSSA